VKHAQAVAKPHSRSDVTYAQCDFLLDDPPAPNRTSDIPLASWDLIKGTYDAIALAPKDVEGRSPAVHYPECRSALVEEGRCYCLYANAVGYHIPAVETTKNVQNLGLLIADEIQMVGSEVGPTYEVIISRTRYVRPATKHGLLHVAYR
jgi:hypothetical protein